MKIAFIGGGNMGEAMLEAVLGKKLADPAGIAVADISRERLDYLKKRYGVAVGQRGKEAAAGRDIVVLVVKPQNLPEVAAALKGNLEPGQLLLSIMAGVSIAKLSASLGHDSIVRVMPNMPAQVGYGASGWTATAAVTGEQKEWTRAILGAMGKEIYFADEACLDMVTAVSGSGPAYFFLLAEALIDAAVGLGLPRPEAEALVSQTMLGAAHLMVKSGRPPAELRRNVTSRGGTTEKALGVFEAGGFAGLVADAVRAAHRRAKELGS
ncbi:MAG TPA: pyrroline-5-carboxylate reductase [Dehalococcoidales bacterium]|nr:MAG: pyrroline-5-carboxylate reductase [Chloroflexi bacterium RBG_16_60_22]HJX13808.1 pyrroline-5-carboxylate reductase [Dehalococcoidales bacterium]